MLAAWSRHLASDTEAKKKFEDMVEGSKLLTDRLQDILESLEANLEFTELSDTAFDNPNWAYKQAYMNGCKAMLRRVKVITDVKEH